jgi:hypothetical protein
VFLIEKEKEIKLITKTGGESGMPKSKPYVSYESLSVGSSFAFKQQQISRRPDRRRFKSNEIIAG